MNLGLHVKDDFLLPFLPSPLNSTQARNSRIFNPHSQFGWCSSTCIEYCRRIWQSMSTHEQIVLWYVTFFFRICFHISLFLFPLLGCWEVLIERNVYYILTCLYNRVTSMLLRSWTKGVLELEHRCWVSHRCRTDTVLLFDSSFRSTCLAKCTWLLHNEWYEINLVRPFTVFIGCIWSYNPLLEGTDAVRVSHRKLPR